MTTFTALRAIPPDQRLALVAVARSEAQHDVNGLAMRVVEGTVAPAYLRLHDRGLRIDADGTHGQSLVAHLASDATVRWLLETLPVESDIVVSLDAWDAAFRDTGLFGGNVYLASEAAVAGLYAVATTRQLDVQVVRGRLDELHAIELIYRFPVAVKFRGAFGADNQCRLNGWGRRLAQSIRACEPARAEEARLRIIDHISEHRADYQSLIDVLVEASDDGDTTAVWNRVGRVPVGILL